MKQVILASQSLQRKAMMETLGIPFEIIPANIDESAVAAETLAERAKKIAFKKAQKIVETHPQAIIIAADTFCDLDGKPHEKPKDTKEAKEMLKAQSGKWLKGYTGFAYLDKEAKVEISDVEIFEFKFRPLSEAEIDFYISQNPVTTWSAAFAPAYATGMALLETMKGSLTAFSHGLPMERLVPLLKKSGVMKQKE